MYAGHLPTVQKVKASANVAHDHGEVVVQLPKLKGSSVARFISSYCRFRLFFAAPAIGPLMRGS